MIKKFALLFFISARVLSFGQETSGVNKYIAHYVEHYTVNNNIKTVLDYLASNQDNTNVLYILGNLHLQHNEIDLAIDCMKKAEAKGFVPAMNALGDIYYSDKKDIEIAVFYYEKGAKKGYGPSQFNLGIIYKKHLQNAKKAKYWLKKASENKKDFDEHVRNEAKKH